MSKVKVAVFGSPLRTVYIDTTLGAQIEALRRQVQALQSAGAGARHSQLQGLQVGDDHPQYTMWQAPETIMALWNFQQEPNIEGSALTEFIEDVVGGELVENSDSVTWTYADTDNSLQAHVLESWAPVWTANHRWVDGAQVQLGTGGDFILLHDGVNATIENDTGDLVVDSAGGVVIGTGGDERLEIAYNGEWSLAGNSGTDGQVLTSRGAAAAPEWADAGGSSSGGAVYVNTSVPAGNTVANTTTETAVSSSYTFDGPVDLTKGSIVRLKMFGTYGTDASVAPTLRVRVKMNSTTVLDTTAVTLPTSISNRGWSLEALMVVHTGGSSGSVEAQAFTSLGSALSTALSVHMQNTAGVSVDLSSDVAVTATFQWGTADSDNTVTTRIFALEKLSTPTIPELITVRGTPSRQDLASAAVSVTINKPTGVVENDYMLVYLARENALTTNSWAAVTPPSGWTQLQEAELNSYAQLLVFGKRAGSSEPTDYTFTWPSSPALYTEAGEAGIAAFAGVNTTTAVADSNFQNNSGTSSSLTAPSVTADANSSKLVCYFVGGDGNGQTSPNTQPGSMTQLTKSATGIAYNHVTVAMEDVVTGATGTRAATFDSSAFSSRCISVMLKPA